MTELTHIVSADPGHGSTNIAIYDMRTGKTKTGERPTIRARVTGKHVDLGGNELNVEWAEFGGVRYASGADALLIGRNNIERQTGASRYGGEPQMFAIVDLLARMNIPSGSVISLTAFMPPGMYQDKGILQMAQDRYNAFQEVEIQLAGDKKPRHYSFSDVKILPECIAGAFCIALNADGSVNQNSLLRSAVMGDFGMRTADFIELTGGKIITENMALSTFENAGIREQILMPMLRELHDVHRDFRGYTVDDLDIDLRSFLNLGQFNVQWAGHECDMTERYHFWRHNYATFIANNVISAHFNDFRDFEHAIIFGGGFALTEDILSGFFPGKIFNPKKVEHVKKIRSLDWNRDGGLRMALFRARKAGLIA